MVKYRPLTLLLLLALAFASCNEGEAWIKAYGYNPVRPANTLLLPGALLMRNEDVNDSARMLCSADASLGPHFVARYANTVNGKFTRTRKVGWKLGADLLSQAKANANADDVSEVYVTLANAQIVHITDAEIYENVKYRTADCRRAVARRRQAGYAVSMIKSALVGDVTYNIKFTADSSLDASAKVAQIGNLALNLGGNINKVTETNASATGLVWGIREDMFLAAISFEEEPEPLVRRNSRMLPDDLVVEAGEPLTPMSSLEDD